MTAYTVLLDDTDITASVVSAQITIGLLSGYNPLQRVAEVGTCALQLNNETRQFTPGVGSVRPGLVVEVKVNERVVFYGFVRVIRVDPGQYEVRRATIECADWLALLQGEVPLLPALRDVGTGQAVQRILNAALLAPRATLSSVVTGVPADGDTFTVDGITYRFKDAPEQLYDVQRVYDETLIPHPAVSTALSQRNLNACIAGATVEDVVFGSPPTAHAAYFPGTPPHPTYTPTGALYRGEEGNAIEVSATGGWITGLQPTLVGGADAPAGKLDIAAGKNAIVHGGDGWGEGVTALSALISLVMDEFGRLWVARDGTIVFRDRSADFATANSAPVLVLDNNILTADGELSAAQVFNRVSVSYHPRRELAFGVIARADDVISVPGRGMEPSFGAGINRRSTSDPITPEHGKRVVRLPFVDESSGQNTSAIEIAPSVPGTDFTVNDAPDGSGFDYTNSNRIRDVTAEVPMGLEIELYNTALGTLYLIGYQRRGILLTQFREVVTRFDHADSQALFGVHALEFGFDSELEHADVLAEALASYLLARLHGYDTLDYHLHSVSLVADDAVMDVEIGDSILVSEYQTAQSAAKYLVTGLGYVLEQGGAPLATLYLAPLTAGYLTLDDATFGTLDLNRLAL